MNSSRRIEQRMFARPRLRDYRGPMFRVAAGALLVLVVVSGCRTTRTVARGTARVVTAPAHFVGRKIRGDERSVDSDRIYEAQPVAELPTAPPPRSIARATPSIRPESERSERTVAAGSTSPSSAPAANPRISAPPPAAPRSSPSPVAEEFPTAKSVPGKPGYVYSPFDGTMIDVTGFASGAKAKDPGNNKIFVVP